MQYICTPAGMHTHTHIHIHLYIHTLLQWDLAYICMYLVVINQVNTMLITNLIMLSLAFYLFSPPMFYLDVQI